MKLNAAITIFENLLSETNRKSEMKVYRSFIGILSDLKSRDLTDQQLKTIEEKLDFLRSRVDHEIDIKYYRQQLNELKKYLKTQLSLISEGYYSALGTGLGVAFGAAFGPIIGMGIGLSFGLLIGLIIGASMDSHAKKQNRVLKSN